MYRKYAFQYVVGEYVDPLYRYERMGEFLSKNIDPVCMESVASDGITKPPRLLLKRGAGRPKKKRIRKRSRVSACNPDLTIKCSVCHEKRHNRRSCPQIVGNDDANDDDNLHDLDLS